MMCYHSKIKSIDPQNVCGCSEEPGKRKYRWGNWPRGFELFVGEYINLPLKPNSEEKFYKCLYRDSVIKGML